MAMTQPITYVLSYGMAKLALTLTPDRFISQGSMQNVDIPLSALRNFCVAPVANNLNTYDSQLIVSWNGNGKTESRKIYVRQTDPSFQQFLGALQQMRPDASLLHLPPAEAQKQMGVMSTNKLAWVIALAIVAVVAIAAFIFAFKS
jgi:hypothetical protein